jgi:uncharacterized membrane protein YgdD (TMEM256/DUF423 family)
LEFLGGIRPTLLSVVFGAFGAHVLKHHLSEAHLNAFEVGVRYQMYHSLALIALSLLLFHFTHFLVPLAGWTMFVGMAIFSLSLYILALAGITAFGMITPIGGLVLVVSWLLLLVGLLRS